MPAAVSLRLACLSPGQLWLACLWLGQLLTPHLGDAVGAEPREDERVGADLPRCDQRGTLVQSVFVCAAPLEGDVRHPATAGADDMGVSVSPKVEALASGDLDRENVTGVCEEMQVAIDGRAAHMAVLRTYRLVDLISRRMVAPGPHGVQHQLTLSRVSPVCHSSPSLASLPVACLSQAKFPCAYTLLLRLSQLLLDSTSIVYIIVTVTN